MTDAVFSTAPTTSPPSSAIQPKGIPPTGVPVVTNTPTQFQIPIVPPIVAQGAANAQGVGVLAGKGTAPLSTPLQSGGQSYLSLLSNGNATMQSIP
jgi:hypothetical protein